MKFFASMTIGAVILTASVLAQEADRDLYAAALAREKAVRAALTGAGSPSRDATLRDVHAIVTAYQTIVRRFPGSGYSDDALWQAGSLELDAFTKFGETRDKEIADKLLQRLVADYPTSKHVKKVPRPVLVARPLPAVNAPQPAQSAMPVATIKSIKRIVLPDVVRVVIEIDGEVPFHDERISDPDRLFVDLAPAQTIASLAEQTLRFASDSDIVRQARLGRQPNRTTRVVLDASGVSTYSIYALYEPYRLVIDCVRGPRPGPPPLPLVGKYYIAAWARKLPGTTPRSAALIRPRIPSGPPPEPVTAVVSQPAAVPELARRAASRWRVSLDSASRAL
jgi:N-acetylmuramoyl-L-alanine amidase